MKVLKILGIVLIVLLVLLVGGVFYLTRFVNTPEFKQQVLDAANKAAGTDVKVGEMKVSLFSGIDLQNVAVANPEGFTGSLVTVKSFALHYRLLPLLQKRVEVETLAFDSPVITLAKNNKGDWNYEKLGGPSEQISATAKSAAAKPTSSGSGGLDIAVSRIELKHASVVMLNDSGKELLRITDANFTSSVNLSGSQLTGSGRASIEQAVAANSLFIHKVSTPVAITTDAVKLAPLTGKVADGDITGDAGLTLTGGSKYSVNLQVKNADVVKLIQEAGVAKRVFSSGKLQLSTALTGTGGLATMAGSGKAEITGGQLVDIPVLNLLATLLQISALQNLKFDECRLEYTIANNVMETPVISLKSPQVQITGKGSVALEDYSLNHTLTLTLAKGTLDSTPKEVRSIFTQQDDGSFTLEFKVWGPYDAPKTDLEKRVLKGAADQLLQKGLQKLLK
ncbi:MAG TPA: AsmA family protein [Verrucomicrobiae bacterium]|nr:AsmA family protein [Verrucomicrobiae bacterium]